MAPGLMIVKNQAATNWSLEKGYKDEITANDFTFRVYESGRGAALEILLDLHERDFEFACNIGDQGFLATLNSPDGGFKHSVNTYQ